MVKVIAQYSECVELNSVMAVYMCRSKSHASRQDVITVFQPSLSVQD